MHPDAYQLRGLIAFHADGLANLAKDGGEIADLEREAGYLRDAVRALKDVLVNEARAYRYGSVKPLEEDMP